MSRTNVSNKVTAQTECFPNRSLHEIEYIMELAGVYTANSVDAHRVFNVIRWHLMSIYEVDHEYSGNGASH